MSQKPARVVRPVKPKVVPAPLAEASPAVVPVPEPTPEVVADPVAPGETPQLPAEVLPVAKPKQRAHAKVSVVSISAARTRRHLDKLGLNRGVDERITALKAELAPYKAAKLLVETGKKSVDVVKDVDGKPQTVSEIQDVTENELVMAREFMAKLAASASDAECKITALSRERTRFSNESASTLSIIFEELIRQIGTHAMDRVLVAKKKIIQVSHLYEPGIEKISLFPLIKSLPLFHSTSEKLAKASLQAEADRLLQAKLVQAEKDFKKKHNVTTPKKKAAEMPAPVPVPPAPEPSPEEEEDEADSKITFRFYVHQVCKDIVKSDDKYKAIRVSTEIRAHLSDLLVELVKRLSGLFLLTAGSMKNKTINEVAILRTVETLLTDGHFPVETIEYQDAQIPDPQFVKDETVKRDASKKDGSEYKAPETVPMVKGTVAVRTRTYPTSGFADLAKLVQEKLKAEAAQA